MATPPYHIKSVAIIGAGAAGAVAAAALKAEDHFERIRVFERRGGAGGTWIYDPKPGPLPWRPGANPPEIDPPIQIPPGPFPQRLPRTYSQIRFEATPIYDELTTNVPDVAMSFTDLHFAYGPFAPHWIPRQYIENYFATHRTDELLVLNTTVEDVSLIGKNLEQGWRLTLRKNDGREDVWWQEEFDAVIIANGHYSVPYIPSVPNLSAFAERYPGRVEHSKTYRAPREYRNQRVLVIGNSASGHDVMTQLQKSQVCRSPIYVSRRSRSRWDGDFPPEGVEWKPVIKEFDLETGEIHFVDGTKLSNVDRVIYCTGYRASFPFWNEKKNGRPFYDYKEDRIIENYQHTFITDFPNIAVMGMPRVLTFRSFEYQAIAVARLWSNRAASNLPEIDKQRKWLRERAKLTHDSRRRFHQIEWDCGETMEWFRYLFELAGLPALEGIGRCPPVLDAQTRWAINHIKKYPDRGVGKCGLEGEDMEWEMIDEPPKDSLWYL